MTARTGYAPGHRVGPVSVIPIPKRGHKKPFSVEIKHGAYLRITYSQLKHEITLTVDEQLIAGTKRYGQTKTKTREFFEDGGWVKFVVRQSNIEVRLDYSPPQPSMYIRHLGPTEEFSEWSCRACGEWNEVTDDPFCVNCENIREED